MSTRELRQIVNGDQVSDGAGVQLKRIIGSPQINMLDPFLLFDAFGSDKPKSIWQGSHRIRTVVLKRSPTCSQAKCAMKITRGIKASLKPAACNG